MSHLYFLFTENGYAKPEGGLQEKTTCKIGITNNPKSRFDQFQTGMHETLMAHTWKINDSALMETFLHNMLTPYRIRGEWFGVPHETFILIERMLCSVGLYCECVACRGHYNIQRVAQEQLNRIKQGGLPPAGKTEQQVISEAVTK